MANQTRMLAELLSREGVHVELVQTNVPYWPRWVHRLRGVRALLRLLPYIICLWRCAGRVDVFHVMANSGWSWHLFVAPAIWTARLRGVPVVINYRGGEARAFLTRQISWVRPSLRAARILAVPSGFLCDVFGFFGVRAEILPNIVDLQRFRFRPVSLMALADPHVVVARNLEVIYDISTALQAFALLLRNVPGARLTVAGDGPELDSLRGQARCLGIDGAVSFCGRIDRDGMADLMRTADIALNPSRVDNMPNAILEALASGVPIVSTRAGGVPYMVEHEVTAVLVDVGDVSGMAAALLRIVNDRALAARLVTSGKAKVEQHTWNVVRDRLGSLYRRAAMGSDAKASPV